MVSKYCFKSWLGFNIWGSKPKVTRLLFCTHFPPGLMTNSCFFFSCDVPDSAPVPTIIPNKAEVQEGTALVLECWTPAHCPILPPLLTWTPQLGDVTEVVIEAEGERVASVIAVTNFNATYQHNRLEVTCSAIYRRQAGRTEVSTRSLLRLQVLRELLFFFKYR